MSRAVRVVDCRPQGIACRATSSSARVPGCRDAKALLLLLVWLLQTATASPALGELLGETKCF